MTLVTSKQLLIGLPSTGKTTFLAALWYTVTNEEVANALRLHRLHGDTQHLNKICDLWCNCNAIERTRLSGNILVSMQLTDSDVESDVVEIYFPDMSGEEFRQHWSTRQWSTEYDELVREAAGAILMVHPATLIELMRIDQAASLVDELTEDSAEPTEVDEPDIPFDPLEAATQTVLVDLCQLLLARRMPNPALRLALIVSAWDLVEPGVSPDQWVTKRLPLLRQFLDNNPVLKTRTYGVSAQGGDIEKDVNELRGYHKPTDRIKVVGPEADANDLTAPLKWLMSAD